MIQINVTTLSTKSKIEFERFLLQNDMGFVSTTTDILCTITQEDLNLIKLIYGEKLVKFVESTLNYLIIDYAAKIEDFEVTCDKIITKYVKN